MLVKKQKKIFLFLSLLGCFWTEFAFSLKLTSSLPQKTTQYISNPADLKASLVLDTKQKIILLYPKKDQLEKRIMNFEKDFRIDPVVLTFEDQEKNLNELLSRISKKSKEENLKAILEKEIESLDKEDSKSSKVKVNLKPLMIEYLDMNQLSKFFEREHLEVSIATNPSSLFGKNHIKNLRDQISMFLTSKQLNHFDEKIRARDNLDLSEDLLPYFPKKMLEKFSVYRGPNCFHASLAFHDLKFGYNPFINIRKETGYHDFMINHDELFYAIQAYFYEVNPQKESLKFGDMIVFYDVEDHTRSEPHFKWIKHASTYLLADYVFSKGSKQADTPYSVKTISDEWRTWKKFTKNLGVKVFRRSQKSVTKRPPIFLDEWLY